MTVTCKLTTDLATGDLVETGFGTDQFEPIAAVVTGVRLHDTIVWQDGTTKMVHKQAIHYVKR